MNDTQLEAYAHGFMDKCASHGIHPDVAKAMLIKEARFTLNLGPGATKVLDKINPKNWSWFKSKGKQKVNKPGANTTSKTQTGGGTTATQPSWGRRALGGAGNIALWTLGPMGVGWAYDKLFGGGDTTPQEQPGGGGYQQQQPQRPYGQPKLNVKGLGGIKPFLT